MATLDISSEPVEATETNRVTIGTWLRFLVGGREAILRIAGSDQALWLGLVFVLSTGFAREYDGADLRSEPWHLVLPLVASLGTSLVLWSLVHMAATRRGLEHIGFWSGYRTLLTFYWMTAPLAWIYAIPVERFLSPGDATAANFWFLGVVSAWRVLLITRALSVWLKANFFAMFFLVLFFADSVAILLAFASPMPIFNVMGGIRHSEVDRVVLDVLLNTRFLAVVSWPVWLVGAIVILVRQSPWSLSNVGPRSTRISMPLWALATLLIVLGGAILPLGQSQQRHAYEAAALMRANDLAAAVEYLGQLQRTDLPPIWDPPPRIGFGESTPEVSDMLEEIDKQGAHEWITKVYVDKLLVDPRSSFESALPFKKEVDAQKLARLLSSYTKFVPSENLDRQQREDLIMLLENREMDADLRKQMRDYLKWPVSDQSRSESSPPINEQ